MYSSLANKVKSIRPRFSTVYWTAVLLLLAFLLLIEQPLCNSGIGRSGSVIGKYLADKLARDQKPTDFKRFVLEHNLTWCFISQKKTHKITGELGLFPAKVVPVDSTHTISLNGRAYWDCVTLTNRGDAIHVGLATARLLPTRLVDPAENYPALWIVSSLALLAGLAFILADLLYTGPLRRSSKLVNSALRTHHEALDDLPEQLPASLGVTEIRDLTEGFAELCKSYAAQNKASELEAQTKAHRPAGKKADADPVLLNAVPAVKAVKARKSAGMAGGDTADQNFAVADHEPPGSLATFARDLIASLDEELDSEGLLFAYASLEGESKFKIGEHNLENDGELLLLQGFIGKSEAAINAILTRELVQVSDRAMGQWGLADLSSRMHLSKLFFFELARTSGHWEGLLLATRKSREGADIDIKVVQRFVARQKQRRAYLQEQAGKERNKLLNPASNLPNSDFLEETIYKLFQNRTTKKGNSDPFSVVSLTIGFSSGLVKESTYDKQIIKLAEMLETIGHLSDPLEEPSAYGRYAIHMSGDNFLLIDGWADSKESVKLAEKYADALMADRLSGEEDCLPVCHLGVASFPENGDSLAEIVHASRVACQYGQSFGRPNSVFAARDLPESGVLLEDVGDEMRGDLAVLNSSVLIQSVRSSARTGELQIVSGNDGRALRMLWEKGKPVHARFGNLTGAEAMIEFLVTCNRGYYLFRDRKLGGFTHVLPDQISLDKVLLDAALACDFRDAARQAISPTDTISGINRQRLSEPGAAAKLELSAAEMEIAQKLTATATAGDPVADLRQKMAAVPDFRFWRILHQLCKTSIINLEK